MINHRVGRTGHSFSNDYMFKNVLQSLLPMVRRLYAIRGGGVYQGVLDFRFLGCQIFDFCWS